MEREKTTPSLESILNQLSEKKFRRGINYGLRDFQNTLKKLGDPEKKCKNIIHIAGTNGKGSTLSYLKYALIQAGFTVGTYTSPHLVSYLERITFKDKLISKSDFIRHITPLLSPDYNLTEFEILTALAFSYFAEKKPDYLLLETGLGGRLDATNVITPNLSIITTIGLDHTQILGSTLLQITREKCGIIKQNIPIVTTETQAPIVLEEIQKDAAEKKAPLLIAKQEAPIPTYTLQGHYQRINLGMALTSLRHLFGEESPYMPQFLDGLKTARHWGRFTQIHHESGTVVIDCAHNPNGIQALIESLKKKFPNTLPTWILGISKEKDAKEMIAQIKKEASEIFIVEFSDELGLSYKEIQKRSPVKLKKLAIQDIPSHISKTPLLIITGSIYFLGNIKPMLDKIEKNHTLKKSK